MVIGTLDLGSMPLLLAPMENVTSASFRLLCKEFGADVVYTEFVNSDGLIRGAVKSRQKMQLSPAERPAGIQIYGQDLESMRLAAEMALEAKPDILDLNFGCPVKKIAGRGAGAGMLRDVPKLLAITESIVKVAGSTPVTVKTRLGWDAENIIIESLAKALQEVGIAALTIHGRTRAQLYTGQADWSYIQRVKENPKIAIPIIGNGDIRDGSTALEAFKTYGVDGVMIGRATYGYPWIFSDIKHYLAHGTPAEPLSVEKRVEIARRHLHLSLEEKGERRGVLELRRHLASYFKGFPHFRVWRRALLTEDSPSELERFFDQIAEAYHDYTPTAPPSSPWIEEAAN